MNTQPTPEQERNHAFARQINRQTRADPSSPYAGKYLGIAGEQVLVVADSLDEVNDQLDALGFGRDDSLFLEASADYDSPIMFWGVRELRAVGRAGTWAAPTEEKPLVGAGHVPAKA